MASGWANDDAVNEQINSTIEDAVARARGEIPRGESLTECEECGETIPEARRKAMPGVRLCVSCQQVRSPARWRGAGRGMRVPSGPLLVSRTGAAG